MLTYREALANAVVPALVVGPLLGAAGAFCTALTGTLVSEGSGNLSLALFAAIVGSVIGMVTAGPICLVAGAVMLRLAAAHSAWRGWWRFALAGGLVGAAAGALFGLASGDGIEPVIGASVLTAPLGVAGALVFRRMIRRSLAELDGSDAEVFA